MILELSLKLTGGQIGMEMNDGQLFVATGYGQYLPLPETYSVESVRGIRTFTLTYTTPESCAAVVKELRKGQEPE